VTRILTVLVMLGLLSGCSSLGSLVSGEDNSEPPAPLEDLVDALPLKRIWSADVGVGYDEQFVRLVPAAQGEQLFVADRKGRVIALNISNGKRNWEARTKTTVSAGPGTGEGLVLVGTSDAEVLALDAEDGSLLWTAFVSSEVLAVPRVDSGVVVVQTSDGKVAGLSVTDGQRLWIYDRSVPVLTLRGTSTPAVERGLVVAGFANGKLAALSSKNGMVAWESSIAIPRGRSELERMVDIDADPVISGRTVYAATFQGRVVALDIQSGDIIWQKDMSSYAGIGVDFAQLYVTDEGSNIWALSRELGASVWKQDKLANRMVTGPEPFGSYIAVGDFEGYVHLLSRYDGHIVARGLVDKKGVKATPLALNDRLFVYGSGGVLAAFALPQE